MTKLIIRKKVKNEENIQIFEKRAEEETSDLRGDELNLLILFLLYLLQGIPIGLTSAIPMLLQNRGANYKQQAEFSFSYFPFSLKLFWAPIVDSIFNSKFGRRKSWLIPSQYLIAIFMMFLSLNVEKWIDSSTNIELLTVVFFTLNLLAATQDIAVDGWALTMLKKCNVSYASTCNSVGQTTGYFLGYVVFIALESKDFCNTYIRSIPQDVGLITLSKFLWFWGLCFCIMTTLIAVFKKENREEGQGDFNILESYINLVKILKLRPIQILILILLTVKITFSASDAVSSLKLIDAGVPKEKLALLVIPIIPLQIILPIIISKYTNGPKPLTYYVKAIAPRMFFAFTGALIVFVTPLIITSEGEIPSYYYMLLITNYALYQIFLYVMFVSIMAFFAKISDPIVGGTYMTLLNTVCNFGGNWPNTAALWLVDGLSLKNCKIGDNKIAENSCNTETEIQLCEKVGGICTVQVDGYYVESILCLFYGVIWLILAKKWIFYLENLSVKEFLIGRKNIHKKR